MPDAFGPVLFSVCGLSILGAVVALISMRKTWEEYGKSSRLVMDRDLPHGPAMNSSAALPEPHTEIRELLHARTLPRQRLGEPRSADERELYPLPAPPITADPRREGRDLLL